MNPYDDVLEPFTLKIRRKPPNHKNKPWKRTNFAVASAMTREEIEMNKALDDEKRRFRIANARRQKSR